MTTFWLSFTDSEATADKRFLGVAIFDMDESAGELSTTEIIKHAWALGVNPGGAVSVQEIGSIPNEHKNKLITDDALLLSPPFWVRVAVRTSIEGRSPDPPVIAGPL